MRSGVAAENFMLDILSWGYGNISNTAIAFDMSKVFDANDVNCFK